MINQKTEIKAMILSLSPQIKTLGVSRLGLFGSFVRNEQTPESDVDFWVEFAPTQKKYKNFIALAYLLEKNMGRSTELVTPESLSSGLKIEILKELEYVFETE